MEPLWPQRAPTAGGSADKASSPRRQEPGAWKGGWEAGAVGVTNSPSSSRTLDKDPAPSPRKSRREKGRTGEQEVRGRPQLCHLLVQK